MKIYLCIVSDYEEYTIFKAFFDNKEAENWKNNADRLIRELDVQVSYDVRERYWNLKKEEFLKYGITEYYYKFATIRTTELI